MFDVAAAVFSDFVDNGVIPRAIDVLGAFAVAVSVVVSGLGRTLVERTGVAVDAEKKRNENKWSYKNDE